MTTFQKCVLVFIGEFLVILICLVAAVGAQSEDMRNTEYAKGALLIAVLTFPGSLVLIFTVSITDRKKQE